MRLRIPQPVQLWLNSISTSKKRHFSAEKLEEQYNEDTITTTPLIVESIQNLCYEIFALPLYKADAVNVAQTICGHIYDIAQSSDPSLQIFVLDLLPTLVHVYLVLSTTLSSGLGSVTTDERVPVSRHQAVPAFATGVSAVPTATATKIEEMIPKARKSLRERLKKSSTTSVPVLRRPNLNRLGNQYNRRLIGESTLDPVNASNIATTTSVPPPIESSSHSSSSATAKTCKTTNSTSVSSPTSRKTVTVGAHMASLAAVLEALLLGLYNTFVRRPEVARYQAVLNSAPPLFASGSVFSGALRGIGRKDEQMIAENVFHLLPTRESPGFLHDEHVPEECELTACNRWRVLGLLCRLCTDRVCDLTDRGREALCYLALLLGPRGLSDHRFPPPVILTSPNQYPYRVRWRRFARTPHQRRYKGGVLSPPSPSESRAPTARNAHVTPTATRLDIARITAPLRSVAAMHRKQMSGGGVTLRSDANVIEAYDGQNPANMEIRVIEENKDEGEINDGDGNELDLEASASRTPSSSVVQNLRSSSSGTSEESSSNSSFCSEDVDGHFVVLNEEVEIEEEAEEEVPDGDEDYEEGEEDEDNEEEELEGEEGVGKSKHRHPPLLNGVNANNDYSNVSNVNIETQRPPKSEVEERLITTQSTLDDIADNDDDEDDVVTAHSCVSSTADVLSQQNEQEQQEQQQKSDQQRPHTPPSIMVQKSKSGRKKKSKRPFYALQRNSVGGSRGQQRVPSRPLGVQLSAIRIPRPPAHFVLDLLPGLHFVLTTEQGHLAAAGIEALARRATLELWSNVLLYTNSICNSKVYRDVATIPPTQDSMAVSAGVADQSNQSNALTNLRPYSPIYSPTSSSGASSTMGEEQHQSSGPAIGGEVLRSSKAPIPITNASFQSFRLEEDIPVVKINSVNSGQNVTASDSAGGPSTPMTFRLDKDVNSQYKLRPRTQSLSPRRQTVIPSQFPSPKGNLHCLNCAACSNDKASARQRTLSFNARLCGALRSSRSKSPYNLRVTFADEVDVVRKNAPPPTLSTPTPSASSQAPRSI